MNDLYVSSAADGFKPLLLPLTGEELQPGRQYLLTPLARLIIEEVYGFNNIPTVVECLSAKRPATIIRTCVENVETGEVKWSQMECPSQPAIFRAFLSKGKHFKFELDLKKMDEMVPFYDKSHKLPIKEEEWLAVTSKYPRGKFRGCTLRWWDAGATVGRVPGAPRAARKVDISILLDI